MGVNDRDGYDDALDEAQDITEDLRYDDAEEISDIWVVQVEIVDEDSDEDSDEPDLATFGPFPPRQARALASQLGSRLNGVVVEVLPVFPHRTVDEIIGFFYGDDAEDDEELPLSV